ncbi:MAG: DUF1295 domain-containing protein [Deltaproteobacteria bacterium]|nr:DUF1295 domain-containing protein [Deltaproteobacteria bacterium]
MEYIILIIFWVAWCALHSGMISQRFTIFLKQHLGLRYRYYRLFFNLLAMVTLIPPVWYGIHLRKHLLWQVEGFWTLLRWGLLAVAVVLSIAGAMKYDLRQFLGLRQIMTGRSAKALTASGQLDTTGILGITRHPWYLAALILVWAGSPAVYVSTLIVQVVLSLYLIVGTLLEERKLIVEYGAAYRDYQKRVSMLLPVKCLSCKAFWTSLSVLNRLRK